MVRRWCVPLVATLLLLLTLHQLYLTRKPPAREDGYDVRYGVPLVESERQVDPEDDPKNTIILKESGDTEEQFADEKEVEEIIETEKEEEEVYDDEVEEERLEREELEEAWEEEENDDEDEDIFKIHINSYQRSGSSFVGKLFDVYEPAFFVYEPLEMLYTSLYGVEEDNVVPHNIFFTHREEHRTLDTEELEMTRWAMDSVFNCNMQAYPTSMLINIFWSKFSKFMSVGIPYVACLEKAGINMTLSYSTLTTCQQHIRHACANTYSTKFQDDLDNCRSVMFANGVWQNEVSVDVWLPFEGTQFGQYRDNFKKYFECLSPFEVAAHQCAVRHLDRECEAKDVRVVKTVRAPMDLSEVFLRAYNNFKVVHLFRDPRGVTLSRMKADWSYAIFENDDPLILARTYCRVIMNEIFKKENLESQYPGRIVSLVHDELLNDATTGAKEIFTNLKLKFTEEVGHYVEVYTKMSKRDRWRSTLTVQNIRSIENECHELMAKIGFENYVPNAVDDKVRMKRNNEFIQKKQATPSKNEQ